MSIGTVYFLSLKFAPGLMKEFLVLGENVRTRGFSIKYLLSESYASLEGGCKRAEYITVSDGAKSVIVDTIKFFGKKEVLQIFSANPPGFLCFYNTHPLNPLIARLVRNNFPEAKLALYLHDPYKMDKSHYGMARAAYIQSIELIQGVTVKYMDYVVSPSDYSSRLFKIKYPSYKGRNFIAPLLIPDQMDRGDKKGDLFSIVGNANPATGHDRFVEMANHVASKRLDYKFIIISSSNVSRYLKKLSDRALKIVKVINNKIINDFEINEVVRESCAVFRLDSEVTQSGVIPVSYMNATPVIVRDIIGLTQHVKHKHNGYIVPFNCTSEDIIKGMDFMRKNMDSCSENARISYEEAWAEWNWDKYYGWLTEACKNFKQMA